jgi:hypothetical protein
MLAHERGGLMMNALLFDLPPEAAPTKPPEPIVRAAEVEGDYRWTLSRRWNAGPLCAVVGCNPSYADADRDDPTMWRVMGFAFRWGFGGVTMLNIYPFITPGIRALRDWRNCEVPAVDIAIGENISRAAKTLTLADLRIAAWGNLPDPDDVAVFIEGLTLALGRTVSWHCIGTTNSGAPKHPMARGVHGVPDSAQPMPWRPAESEKRSSARNSGGIEEQANDERA